MGNQSKNQKLSQRQRLIQSHLHVWVVKFHLVGIHMQHPGEPKILRSGIHCPRQSCHSMLPECMWLSCRRCACIGLSEFGDKLWFSAGSATPPTSSAIFCTSSGNCFGRIGHSAGQDGCLPGRTWYQTHSGGVVSDTEDKSLR